MFGRAFFALFIGVSAATAAPAQNQAAPPPSPATGQLPRPEWQAPGPTMPGMPGGGLPDADPFHLLVNSREVQADLALSKDQLERLRRAEREFRTEMTDMTRPGPGEQLAEIRAHIDEHIRSTRAIIARELTPEQLRRLRQILFQIEGPCMVMWDDQLARDLALSSDRLNTVAQMCQNRATRIRAAFQPPRPGQDPCEAMFANRTRIEQIRKDYDESIRATLSREEKQRLAQAHGPLLPIAPPIPPGCKG